MGRYTERFWNNQPTDLEDVVGGMFTAGLINLIPDPELAWKCEMTDTVNDLAAEGEEWAPTREVAHDLAWHRLQAKIHLREEEEHQEQEALRIAQEARQRTRDKDDEQPADLNTLLIKWAVYIALFIGAVWLAFAIVLPLVILNAALVLLVCGLIWNENAKVFFAIALGGAIYLLLDIHYHGLSASLMARAIFFQTFIPICVYVNITSALIAAYLLFRIAPGDGVNEFSKRNLIVLAATGVTGICLVLVNIFVNGDNYVIASTAPAYSAPAQVQTAPVVTAPQPATAINGGTPDSARLADSTRAAAEAASATANLQLDTNQVKSDLIGKLGNVQYSDQLTSVSQIQAIDIRDRVNMPGGLSFHALLAFNSARHGQVEMTYLFANGILSFSTARLMELTKLITVPANGWTRILAPAGFVMNFRDDSRMYWKAYDGGQVYESGADVGPLTLPASNEYMVSSRGDGPLAFDVVFTPAN